MTEFFRDSAWPLLASVFLKSLVVLALAAVVALSLRRASAAARHLVWRLCIIALLLLPPLAFLPLPAAWQVPLAPRALLAPPDAPVVVPAVTPHRLTLAADGPHPPAPSPRIGRRGDRQDISENPLPSSGESRVRADFPASLCLVWTVGAFVALLPTLLGLIAVARLTRQSRPLTDGPLPPLAAELAHTLGVSQPVRLRQGDAEMPMTWGWRRPVILLPPGAEEWTGDRLRAVLLHELAHIARADWPAQMAAHLACALYWPNPFVWLAARQGRLESERACDDRVLLAGVPPSDYARHLLDIARTLQDAPLPAALPMARRSGVESRLTAILQPTRRNAMTRKTLTVAALAAAAILAPLTALRPVVRAQAETTPLAADGVTLQIAGVTDGNPSLRPDQRWWDTSGNVLPKPRALLGYVFHVGQPSMTRIIAFRVTAPKNAPVSLEYQPLHSLASSSDGSWVAKTLSTHQQTETDVESSSGGYRVLNCAYAPTVAKDDIRVGIAAGPWSAAAIDRNLNMGLPGATANDSVCIFSPLTVTNGASSVITLSLGGSGDQSIREKDDFRVVATDSHGNTCFPSEIGDNSTGAIDQIQAHFALPLSAIKSIQLQTRPYHWITFQNVALQPQ